MRMRNVVLVGVVAVGLGFGAGTVLSQDQGGMPTEEQMMEYMREHRKLTAEHEQMQQAAGAWDLEMVEYEMDGSGAVARVNKGTSFIRPLFDGRYMMEEVSSAMGEGEHFRGIGLMGYDKQKGQWVNAWMDDWSTGITKYTGTFDASGKVMTTIGEPSNFMGMDFTPKGVVRHIDPNHFVFEMFAVMQDGSEMKHMELHYTRRGSEPLADWSAGSDAK